MHSESFRVRLAGVCGPSNVPASTLQSMTAPDGQQAGGTRVRLAGIELSLDELRVAPERFTGLFMKARAEFGHADCLCRPRAPLRLVIRRRRDRCHLAGWPHEGHLHSTECAWYRPDPELSGRSGYGQAAILTTPEGTAIRIEAALDLAEDARATPVVSEDGRDEPANSRRSLTLLAMLHYLWEQAGLSTLPAATAGRHWRECHERLMEQLAETTVNGVDLASALYVVPSFKRDRAEDNAAAFERFFDQVDSRRRRVLVLGEARDVTPTRFGIKLQLAHLRWPLFASTALHDKARMAHRTAFTDAIRQGGRRVVLCLVGRSPKGYRVVEDLAFMPTNRTYLPVESSFELAMADALVTAGRAIVKPMTWDHHASVLPDFVLTDTSPVTFVEVWGIRGRSSYEMRKRAKQRIYRAEGKKLIEWSVENPMPDVRAR